MKSMKTDSFEYNYFDIRAIHPEKYGKLLKVTTVNPQLQAQSFISAF